MPTYLLRRDWVGEFPVELIPTHFHELPYGIPIRVEEARYQSNHGVLGLKIVPIL